MRCRGKMPGLVIAGAGLFIILAMILPTAFWWFVLGLALIALGVWLMKR